VLFCLTLVRTLTGVSVHHDVRQDGVERLDWRMTPAHGASDRQDRDVDPSLLTSTGSAGPARRRRTRRSRRPFSLSFFSFSSATTRAFPWPIKGKAGRPMKGPVNRSTHQDPIQIRTRARHEHTAEQRLSSQHPLTPFTKDLGSFPSLARL